MTWSLFFALTLAAVIVWLCYWADKKDEERIRNYDQVGAVMMNIQSSGKISGIDPEVLQGAAEWVRSHREEVDRTYEGPVFVAGTIIREELVRRLTSGQYHKSRGCLNEKGLDLLAQYEKVRLGRRNISNISERALFDQEKDKLLARIRRIG